MQARAKDVVVAKEKLAQAKLDNPAEDLAALKATVVKLKAAQAQASVYHARESLATKKREQEKLLAISAEKLEEVKRVTEELNAANDPATKSKLKAALKTATAEAKAADVAAKKCITELASEQARFDKLTADYKRVKTALLSTASSSTLVLGNR
jgi:acetolactate synthase small subunit